MEKQVLNLMKCDDPFVAAKRKQFVKNLRVAGKRKKILEKLVKCDKLDLEKNTQPVQSQRDKLIQKREVNNKP